MLSHFSCVWLFLSRSTSKESTCHTGDPGSVPDLRRLAGEGIGYPLQYSWASLIPQLLKNPPAMWETWVQSLGWKDPLKKGISTHSSILAWRNPWTVCIVHGSQRVRHNWAPLSYIYIYILLDLALCSWVKLSYDFSFHAILISFLHHVCISFRRGGRPPIFGIMILHHEF